MHLGLMGWGEGGMVMVVRAVVLARVGDEHRAKDDERPWTSYTK